MQQPRALSQNLWKRHGKKIRRRLDDLQPAHTLDSMRTLPGRCHELKGNRANQISLDLVHPQRLIFEPANEPIPRKPDGGIDWTQVTAIQVLCIEV